MRNLFVALFLAVMSCFWLTGCSENDPAQVDRAEAQAQATRPVSTEVEAIEIPYDPNLPILVLVVEPFLMGASGVTADTGQGAGAVVVGSGGLGGVQVINSGGGGPVVNPGQQIGPGVSAQLISALRLVGNVVVIDYPTYLADPEKVAASLKPNEVGPFLLKGTVTEFSETADVSGKGEGTGYSVGLAMVPYVGGILAYGRGSDASSETRRKGMVGFDVQIVDRQSGRLLSSFTASGSFVSVSQMKSETRWGKTKTTTEYASSAIGQAQRQANNQAVSKIHAFTAQQGLLAKR